MPIHIHRPEDTEGVEEEEEEEGGGGEDDDDNEDEDEKNKLLQAKVSHFTVFLLELGLKLSKFNEADERHLVADAAAHLFDSKRRGNAVKKNIHKKL